MALSSDSLFIDGDWIESKDIAGEGIKYITTGNVGEGVYKEQGSGFISEPTFREIDCTSALVDDVLISRLNSPIGRACVVPNLGGEVVTSVDNVILRADPLFCRKYLVYLFSSQEYFSHTGNLARGTTMQRISRSLLGNIRAEIPPLKEQTQIARFLDHETARIDALIEEQQRLIELLKEKRQAVISHTVTKGLDPNVPMKDSGVEWLGEVPEHWRVSKLAHYAKVLTGFTFPSASFSHNESDVRLLRGANIGVGLLKWQDTVYWELNEGDALSSYLMDEGQIVLGMDRPWIGEGIRIARVSREDMPCLLLQRVAAITSNKELDDDYLYCLLASELFKAYIEPDLTGVSVPHVSSEQILSYQIPVPDKVEQREIASFIRQQLDRMSALFIQASESIKLLKERRAAIISAAVTGKIDVRNWQPAQLNATDTDDYAMVAEPAAEYR